MPQNGSLAQAPPLPSDPDRILYREMAAAPDGKPRVGDTDLGVRVGLDVKPSSPDLEVHPLGGGMSVAPDDPMNLHQHHRPSELLGDGVLPVWSISVGQLPATLVYRQTRAEHGLLEPAATVRVEQFRLHLASTRMNWERRYG